MPLIDHIIQSPEPTLIWDKDVLLAGQQTFKNARIGTVQGMSVRSAMEISPTVRKAYCEAQSSWRYYHIAKELVPHIKIDPACWNSWEYIQMIDFTHADIRVYEREFEVNYKTLTTKLMADYSADQAKNSEYDRMVAALVAKDKGRLMATISPVGQYQIDYSDFDEHFEKMIDHMEKSSKKDEAKKASR